MIQCPVNLIIIFMRLIFKILLIWLLFSILANISPFLLEFVFGVAFYCLFFKLLFSLFSKRKNHNSMKIENIHKKYEYFENSNSAKIEDLPHKNIFFENSNSYYKGRSHRYIDENGYERFSDSDKLVHRYIMGKVLGRRLNKQEFVHHINGIKNHNHPSNLRVCSFKEHSMIHNNNLVEFGSWNSLSFN